MESSGFCKLKRTLRGAHLCSGHSAVSDRLSSSIEGRVVYVDRFPAIGEQAIDLCDSAPWAYLQRKLRSDETDLVALSPLVNCLNPPVHERNMMDRFGKGIYGKKRLRKNSKDLVAVDNPILA